MTTHIDKTLEPKFALKIFDDDDDDDDDDNIAADDDDDAVKMMVTMLMAMTMTEIMMTVMMVSMMSIWWYNLLTKTTHYHLEKKMVPALSSCQHPSVLYLPLFYDSETKKIIKKVKDYNDREIKLAIDQYVAQWFD